MHELPFDFATARSAYSDEAYAALGRALVFAARFEANCRSLAMLLKIKAAGGPDGFADETSFHRFVEELARVTLFQNAKFLSTVYAAPEDVRATIHAGREARNTIAHEMPLGVAGRLEDEDDRAEFLHELRGLV